MLSKNLQALKVSLNEAIYKWIEQASGSDDGWNEVGYVGDYLGELMTSSAFNILLAQQDVNAYMEVNELLKEN